MRFEIYKDKANPSEWRWRLRAKNKKIIADSGEGYKKEHDCRHGINLVKKSFDAPVYDEDGTRLDKDGELEKRPIITAKEVIEAYSQMRQPCTRIKRQD